MKDDCRLIVQGEFLYYYDKNGIVETVNINLDEGEVVYVNYNNFLHNLNDFAWIYSGIGGYWIHGKYFKNKQQWEIEGNRIKMLEQI